MEDNRTAQDVYEGGGALRQETVTDTTFLTHTTNVATANPMASLLDTEYAYKTAQHGDIVQGVIMQISPTEILIDVGSKSEGIISGRELERMDPELRKSLQVGQQVLAFVVRPEDLPQAGRLLGAAAKTVQTPWGEVSKVELGQVEVVGSMVVRRGAESYRYSMDDEMVMRVRRATWEGVEVPILAPEDVVAMKAVLQRGPDQGKHDLEDIAALASAMEIDPSYLRLRLRRMGGEERARPILERWGWLSRS